jgi:hypothetical protein
MRPLTRALKLLLEARQHEAYPIDRTKVEKQLRALNDKILREESQTQDGGYWDHRFEILPIGQIRNAPELREDRLESLRRALRDNIALPPIRVTKSDEGFIVEDGTHRVGVSRDLGLKFIPAIVATWVDTPQKQQVVVEEKGPLRSGQWVCLHESLDTRRYGWVIEHVSTIRVGSDKHQRYAVALVRQDDIFPDHVDLMDFDFTPCDPPAWGEDAKQRSIPIRRPY